jgi:hypothetical protein
MEVYGTKSAVKNFVKRLEFCPSERTKAIVPKPQDGKLFYKATLNMSWDEVLQEIEERFADVANTDESYISINPSFPWTALSCLFLENHSAESVIENHIISLQDACVADCVDVAFDAEADGCVEIGEADRHGNYRIATKKLTEYLCKSCADNDYITVGKEAGDDYTCDHCGSADVELEKYAVNVLRQLGTPLIAPLTT